MTEAGTLTTIEETDHITALGAIFPPRARALIYLATVMLAAAYAVVEANIDLHWGWLAAYAAWNAGTGVLAAVNVGAHPSTTTTRSTFVPDR